MRKMNVTILGGCHITGWPIGEKFSFPNILEKNIENDTEFSTNIQKTTNVNMKNVSEKILNLKKICTDRNIICLQLGNYETSHSLLNKFKNVKSKKNIASEIQNKNSTKRNYFIFGLFHFFIEVIFRIFGKSSFEEKIFYEQCRNLHFYLQDNECNEIIILSPFPSLHLSVNSRRKIANKIFSDFFKNEKYKYIDTMLLFANKSDVFNFRPNKDYFEDSFHLNAAGHRLLANKIYDIIRL